MGKLTIQEIAKVLVEKNGLTPKEANHFASEFFGVILQQLQQDEQVKVKGLGTFKIINVEARESVSVRTGERVLIDSHSKVSFTPDTTMRELVNKPFSQFETVVLNDGVEFSDLTDDEEEEDEKPQETVVDEVPESNEPNERNMANEPNEPAIVKPEPEVEPEPLPVVEETNPEPEPVKPEPEPVPVFEEPKPESKAVVVEPEPTPIVVEPTPVVVEPAPFVVEPKPAPVDVEPSEDTFDMEEENTPEKRMNLRVLTGLALLLLVVVAILAGYGGYEYGMRQQVMLLHDTIVVHDTVIVESQKDSMQMPMPAVVSQETQSQSPTDSKSAPKAVVKKETKADAAQYDKYAAKDERVRLGAYRIVGTAREVTLQQGQTFRSICKAHLGPDMECYVEVYNDLPRNPNVKAGQVIKIPKLELKKRRK